MAFEFLHDIQESRMTRNQNNQKSLTYTDCKERAFLLLLMLHVMRYSRQHRNDAAQYAKKTVMYRDYQKHRIDSTDLYNLLYYVAGDRNAVQKLRDPGSASKLREKTLLSIGALNGFLRRVGNNDKPNQSDSIFLQQIEKELDIASSDYKNIRRRITVFDTDTFKDRKTTATRLMFAARAKLGDSDLIAKFSSFVSDKNLEDITKTSPEFDASTPDQVVSATDVTNYKLLMPVSTLPFIAKFLEGVRAQKTIVGNFVAAYAPLIIMLDEIIQAGPAYIEQLRQLHNRAKNSRK